jgi:SAM-dependent methyltransferase
MEDLNLLSEYYGSLERQGPGSREVTLKALSFIDPLPSTSQIVDMGCGTGGSTLTLAQNTTGMITGVDIFPRFVQTLKETAQKNHLEGRVNGIVGSMEEISFQDLDLIWSEGAIYNIGFSRGLALWKPYLKKNGFLAVSELSWLTKDRPSEIESFWNREYPEIGTISHKLDQMQTVGYSPIACFVIPKVCWTKNFYEPQIQLQKKFLERHRGNQAAEELVKNQLIEADYYERFGEYYGYVFYIGKN